MTALAPPRESMPIPASGINVFSLLLTYYWALQFVMRTGDQVQRGSVMYWLFVIPIALFSALLLGAMGVAARLNTPSWLVSVYAIVVSAVALVRGDYQTLASTLLLCSALVVIFAGRLSPSVDFLNRLFLLSIALNSLLFLLGRTIYAVIPGFSTGGEFWWRVSAFPAVATSAFFSLIVFFLNLRHRDAYLRKVCLVVSLYFVLFSGIRSALIAGILAGGYMLLVRARFVKRTPTKVVYLFFAVIVLVSSLFLTQLLLTIPSFSSEGLNMYLFRSAEGLQSQEDAARAIYRTWLWSEHLRIASQNPILGVGTFNFGLVSSIDPLFGANGSEAFLTGLYARVGVPAVLLVAALLSAIVRGLESNDDMHILVGLAMFVAMLAYGSFINAYDFVFLVMIGLLAANKSTVAELPRQSAANTA